MQAISVGGSVAVGMVFGHILGQLGRRWAYTIAIVMTGLTVFGISAGAGAYVTLVPLMLLYGLFRTVARHLVPPIGIRPQHHEPAWDGNGVCGVVLGYGAARRAGGVRRVGRDSGGSRRASGWRVRSSSLRACSSPCSTAGSSLARSRHWVSALDATCVLIHDCHDPALDAPAGRVP